MCLHLRAWPQTPEYLKGQYAGSDIVGIADQSFTKDNCKDQTLVDFSKQSGR